MGTAEDTGDQVRSKRSQPGASDEDQSQGEDGLFPVHPKWFKFGFYLFLTIWLTYMLYEAILFPEWEDKFVFYLLASILFTLLAIQFVSILFPEKIERFIGDSDFSMISDDQLSEIGEDVGGIEGPISTRPKSEREYYEIIMLAWVAVLPLMMYYVGLGWTAIIYLFGFVWFFKRDVKVAFLLMVGVCLFIIILFLYFLNMLVWTGVLDVPDPFGIIEGLLP